MAIFPPKTRKKLPTARRFLSQKIAFASQISETLSFRVLHQIPSECKFPTNPQTPQSGALDRAKGPEGAGPGLDFGQIWP